MQSTSELTTATEGSQAPRRPTEATAGEQPAAAGPSQPVVEEPSSPVATEEQSPGAASAQSKGGSPSSASGRSKRADSEPGSAEVIAEAKKQRRLAKNRVTAAQSRERKRAQMETLKHRVRNLEAQNAQLNQTLSLRDAEIGQIREQLAAVQATSTSGDNAAASASEFVDAEGHSCLPVSFRSAATAAGQPLQPPPPPVAAGPSVPPDLSALQRRSCEQQQPQYCPQQPAEEVLFQHPPQQPNVPLCQPAAQQASGQGLLQQQALGQGLFQQQEQGQPMLWYGMFGSQPGNSAGPHSFTPSHMGAQVSLQQAPASAQLVQQPASEATDESHQQPGASGFSLEDCFRGWER